jgi:hypothetical protein
MHSTERERGSLRVVHGDCAMPLCHGVGVRRRLNAIQGGVELPLGRSCG